MHARTRQRRHRHSIFCILPPHVLREIARRGNPAQRNAALKALALDGTMRAQRMTFQLVAGTPTGAAAQVHRTIYNANHTQTSPGTLVRSEGQPPAADLSVNEAYDGLGYTFDFYLNAYQRNSIDDHGLQLIASVHYDQRYDNAFWNGSQM